MVDTPKDGATKSTRTQPTGSRRPLRRHRPREETRALLLATATNLAIERTRPESAKLHNPLADIRIADVLAEVNRRNPDEKKLTTGAFYQIWPDQAAFQRELMSHVMDEIATPGAGQIQALAFELVADGKAPEEIFRQISEADFRWTSASPELFLALGLGALAPVDMVRDAQAGANERYVNETDHLLSILLRYARRRLKSDRTMEDLIWAIEALSVGYLLRSRTHPDIPKRTDTNGWSVLASAYLGVVHAFSEPLPEDTEESETPS
ncbi:hypothetical protein JK364_00430 [Streptomyces sp. 110]|uniref:Tetracyclin repressor-like C-terminal domain-containing protein n=1 Tax=Streptomyces endocoffeicus TaxID=2898945 RepID=A0ABS1PEU9_9ACTN|nr:hypothetical protein [Streptomyces endocoffeicus]MBL1110888.1 hypothetical protein [Streptomyces endocoffeicus]